MNECTTRNTEYFSAYERLARAYSDAAEAFYDLAESAKFHEPASTENEPLQGGQLEHDEGSGVECESVPPSPRDPVTAKPEHLEDGPSFLSWNARHPLPTAASAAECFAQVVEPGKFITMTKFKSAYRKYCRQHGYAQINEKGMRYLLYTTGHEKVVYSGATYLHKK